MDWLSNTWQSSMAQWNALSDWQKVMLILAVVAVWFLQDISGRMAKRDRD